MDQREKIYAAWVACVDGMQALKLGPDAVPACLKMKHPSPSGDSFDGVPHSERGLVDTGIWSQPTWQRLRPALKCIGRALSRSEEVKKRWGKEEVLSQHCSLFGDGPYQLPPSRDTPRNRARVKAAGTGACSFLKRSALKWCPGAFKAPPLTADDLGTHRSAIAPGTLSQISLATGGAAGKSETNWLYWGSVAVVAAFLLLRKK